MMQLELRKIDYPFSRELTAYVTYVILTKTKKGPKRQQEVGWVAMLKARVKYSYCIRTGTSKIFAHERKTRE